MTVSASPLTTAAISIGIQTKEPEGSLACSKDLKVRSYIDMEVTAQKIMQLCIYGKYLLAAAAAVLFIVFPFFSTLAIEILTAKEVAIIGVTLATTGGLALVIPEIQQLSNVKKLQKYKKIKKDFNLASLDNYSPVPIDIKKAQHIVPSFLANRGNTCWIDSFMQIVLNSDLLLNSLINPKNEQSQNIEDKLIEKRTLAAFHQDKATSFL